MVQRPLQIYGVGRPASWPLVGASFSVAVAGWLAAACALVPAAPRLADGWLHAAEPLLAIHLAGLVFLPFAVTGAAWHTLPVMLRNELPSERRLWLALPPLGGGAPLAAGIAVHSEWLTWVSAGLLAAGLVLVVRELAGLVVRAPGEKLLVASRTGVALSALHLVSAFVLGAVAFAADGPDAPGVPFQRLVLVHLMLAGLGWLTLLILAVGRTLVPMLALAPAAPPRRLPGVELVFTGGLWLLLAGIAAALDVLAWAGGAVVVLALGRFGVQVARVALLRRLDAVEGPLAHALAGFVFLAQAAAFGFATLAGALDAWRGTAVLALFLVVGWAGGVTLGHLGKLLSLSAWSTWPPGPRPRQAALYPRLPWKLEAALFAAGVELVGVGILTGSSALTRVGAASVVASALLAAVGCATTVVRVGSRAADAD
ncbi:MAG: hypothetical protein IT201_05870 [Thermoleophilia bacterium]|nr:hypothetical protein [Thermoleophilia bacterium]